MLEGIHSIFMLIDEIQFSDEIYSLSTGNLVARGCVSFEKIGHFITFNDNEELIEVKFGTRLTRGKSLSRVYSSQLID